MNSSWEDQKTAIYLMHAVHQQICAQLIVRNNPDDIPVLNFYWNYFVEVLESATSRPYQIRIAIRGYGLLAEPCRQLLPPADLHTLLTLVMQRMENAAVGMNKIDKEQLEHFPDLVEALSQIMNHVSELTGTQICTLQNIVVSLIRHFHYLSTAHHDLAVNSLMKCFFNLSRLGETVLDDVLSKVVYQGVIWTCSHHLVLDARGDWDTYQDWKDHLTYESYLPLWKGLLSDIDFCDYDRPQIVRKIYEYFMQTLFRLVDKLDLSTRKRVFRDEAGNAEEYFFCDPNYDLEPVKKKDFHIFFNLVQFYRKILKDQPEASHLENFTKWINQYFEIMIMKSFSHPLVSGFYRLIQLGLSICNKITYFKDRAENNSRIEQIDPTFENVQSFIKATIATAQQTSGELQLSCLLMLFSTPNTMLKDLMQELIPVFITAFELGKTGTVMYIANSALSAMERYVNICKPNMKEIMTEFMEAILPHLDVYLQGLSLEATSSATVELIKKKNVRAKRVVKVTESDLLQLQKRILLFIGKLEPDHCLSLVLSDKPVTNLVKWGVTNTIALSLPSGDIRPTIFLDNLLPEICKIAVTATERQKKIAACEIVHSIILYLIGSDNHKGKIWSKLCEEMLLLGCDGDVAVRQMFEPLIKQVMHYMSRTSQIFGGDDSVVILLERLMDGISHPIRAAVRDLSARALREFVTWSIRQLDPLQMAVSPASITLIIDQLKLFSLDSCQNKRQGAALAFNNLYRVLREENAMVSNYWLDLLHTFCMNFLMTEEFGMRHNIATDLEQVTVSLDHVLRVLIAKKDEFNRETEGRIVPSVFSGPLLIDAVKWLFKQCGARQMKFRRKCIKLFQKLVVHVDHYTSMAMFVHDFTPDSLIGLCEDTPDRTGIRSRPNLQHIIGSKSPTASIYNWLEHLLASLDCHIWLVENSAVNVGEHFKRAAIFQVMHYYLNNVAEVSLVELLAEIDEDLIGGDVKTGFADLSRTRSIKCSINIRIFNFLDKLLQAHHAHFAPAFWKENNGLIGVVSKSIFTPDNLGFELKNEKDHQSLPQLTESVVLKLCKYAPAAFVEVFKKQLKGDIIRNNKDLSETAQKILSMSTVTQKDLRMAKGIEMVFRIREPLALPDLPNDYFDVIARELLFELSAGITETVMDISLALKGAPDTIRYSNEVLRICLHRPDIYREIVAIVMNAQPLSMHSMANDQTISRGKHFLNLHKNTIFDYFSKTLDDTIGSLMSRLTIVNIHHILNMCIDFTEHVYRTRQHDKVHLKDIANILLGNWQRIYLRSREVGGTTIELTLIELMTNIAMIYPDSLDEIATRAQGVTDWVLGILSDDIPSDVKSKAFILLPCIIGPNHMVHNEVERELQSLASRYFPLESKELKMGSIQSSSYIGLFQAVLDTLCSSQSPIILRFIINTTAQDHNHIMEHKIQMAIEKFMRQQNPQRQVNSLNVVLDRFLDRNLNPNNRISVMKRFLLTMIRNCTVDNILTFYEQRIAEIVELCESNFKNAARNIDVQHHLVNRMGGFELIDALFGAMPSQRIIDPPSRVPIALLGDQHAKIFGTLSKKAYEVRKDYVANEPNPENMELHRKYQCSAYKALCTLLTANPNHQLKFFSTFVFDKNPWQCLIDSNASVSLNTETDESPRVKERLVSVRGFRGTTTPTLPRYIESQNVFESSLSQDVTRIDLTASTVRTEAEVIAMQAMEGPSTISLEKNSLNDHEVMAPLCATIQWLFENDETPTEANRARRAAPQWVASLCNAMNNTNNSKNVRLFLAMVVDNSRHLFRNYAPTMTKEVLKLITSDWVNDSVDGLVLYLSVTLLEWNEYYTISDVEEKACASDLVRNLMKHAWHATKDVFKKRLELIKSLVEIWRDLISLPRQYLLDSIRISERLGPNTIINGLQVNGIVLANDLLPWSDATKTEYLQLLIKSIDCPTGDVYRPASQVLGMALAKAVPADEPTKNDKEMLNYLTHKLESIRRTSEKKFSDVLYGIHKYYEPIVDTFIPQIINYISTAAGVTKRIYLEMFLSRINHGEERLFGEVMTIRIRELLRSADYQLLALHIINRTLCAFSKDEIVTILPDVLAIAKSKNAECRGVMYEILIYIQKNYVKIEEITNITSPALLNGLIDPDELVQGNIFKFWSNESDLPVKLSDRIVLLFKKLYSPQSEKLFLNYCTQLLLQPAIDSLESKDRILRHRNEDDAKHKEYPINVSWKTQDSAMTAPLFVESQQKIHGNNSNRFVSIKQTII